MHISSYEEARAYLESFIRPMLFQKITLVDGNTADPLERMRILLTLLGNPHKKFPSVIVSGSSGKGSTAYLLSHMLSYGGYKTGLSISPHLQKITERMQINNKNASKEEFVTLVNEIIPVIEKMKTLPIGEPSYFELLLAIAFLHFAKENVAIAVIEVGIEGKYDATNVLDPLLVILTNISLDHIEILGDSIEKIAHEAVGSINQNGTVISGVTQPSIIEILTQDSMKKQAQCLLLRRDFDYGVKDVALTGSRFHFTHESVNYEDLELQLIGEYQVENATLAIMALLCLQNHNFSISEHKIRHALCTATFPGRFERVKYKDRMIILDGAHNPAKMTAFLSSLQDLYPKEKKVFIVTFKKGKQSHKMLQLIVNVSERMILTEFHRTIDTEKNASLHANELISDISKEDSSVITTNSAKEAFTLALETTTKSDLIIVTGSLYLVGEIRDLVAPVSE